MDSLLKAHHSKEMDPFCYPTLSPDTEVHHRLSHSLCERLSIFLRLFRLRRSVHLTGINPQPYCARCGLACVVDLAEHLVVIATAYCDCSWWLRIVLRPMVGRSVWRNLRRQEKRDISFA